jgi:hypothetical protein
MAKIHVKSRGSLVIEQNGELKSIDYFEAPINDCECGIYCCGDKKVIRFQSNTPGGTTKEINLEALWTLLNP